MRLFFLTLCAGCLTFQPANSYATDSPVDAKSAQTERWYVVRSGGKKVGYQKEIERREGSTLTLIETMDMELRRDGQSAQIFVETTTRERENGEPLSFEVNTQASGMMAKLQATHVKNGEFKITEQVAGVSHESTFKLEPEVLFPMALDREIRKHTLAKGLTFTYLAFDAGTKEQLQLDTEVIGQASRPTFQGEKFLFQVKQTMRFRSGADIVSHAWVDSKFNLYELSTEVAGTELTMTAASAAKALSKNDSVEIFETQLLTAPAPIDLGGNQGLRIHFEYLKPSQALPITTSEQRVEKLAAGFSLEICPRCGNESTSAEQLKVARSASAWLQSDRAALREAAANAVRGAKTEADKMQRLEDFVRLHIKDKNLTVGFASALEAYQSQQGDCTEHAMLLAALARSQGIATRVAAGLAYVDEFAGKRGVFVPHAWTQAYIDGRWKSFDAALNGFTAGHITLSTDGDDPTGFSNAVGLLGNLRVTKVRALPRSARLERAPASGERP